MKGSRPDVCKFKSGREIFLSGVHIRSFQNEVFLSRSVRDDGRGFEEALP